VKALSSLFTDHPGTVNETYGQHLLASWSFSLRMLLAACAGLVHGVFPFLFVTTGSSTIRLLYQKMVTQRDRLGVMGGGAQR
jgi:hypothetical protein